MRDVAIHFASAQHTFMDGPGGPRSDFFPSDTSDRSSETTARLVALRGCLQRSTRNLTQCPLTFRIHFHIEPRVFVINDVRLSKYLRLDEV